MEKQELESALSAHGDQIKATQAELLNTIESQKSELILIKSGTAKMQEQLDALATVQAKAEKEGQKSDIISFTEDLRKQLNEKIATFKKFAEDSTFKGEINLLVKSFLESDNANITTNALLPGGEMEAGIGKAPDRMPFLLSLVETGTTNKYQISWVERKTRTDNSLLVAEGVAPANPVVLGYETKTLTVKNFGSYIKISNDSLDDIEWILSEIKTELVTLMMLKIDGDILAGTIALNGYDGIKTLATAFAVPNAYKLNAGDIANNKDVLRAALTQLQVANYNASAIIINPVSSMEMDLERDKDGAYVLAPFTTNSGQVVAGCPVYVNNGVTADEFVVGDFKKAKFVYRKGMDLKIWDQNESDAIAQLKTVTLYMRATMRIKAPDYLAFVKGTFTAGKALLNVV